MSDWIHITGYMVISNDLPCRIGKYGKPFDEEISDKPHNPLGFHDRILWKKPIMEDNGLYVGDEEEDEWFSWDEQKIKDKPLLECLQFPCGSEGPLDVTVTPHIDEWRTSWHVVFDGNLRDRDSSYFEHVKSWWEAMQTMFNVCSGYICCTWLDEKWQDII